MLRAYRGPVRGQRDGGGRDDDGRAHLDRVQSLCVFKRLEVDGEEWGGDFSGDLFEAANQFQPAQTSDSLDHSDRARS
jgi:hypothetical protein